MLAKIGKIKSPKYLCYKKPVQSWEHLCAKCRKWKKKRRKLVKKLEKEEIRWRQESQGQAEKNWFIGVLISEKIVAPLLKFLRTSDVEGEKEPEKES